MAKSLSARGPHTGVMHTGLDGTYDEAEEAVQSPVERWEKILAVLMEAGEIPALSELEIHKRAWELARADAHRAKLRALASAYGEKKSAGRPPGDYCARCASRWCVCPDRQR